MGKDTKIAWTDHTWSPWRGCSQVSEGCDNCYAMTQASRFPDVLGVWGTKEEGGTRPRGDARYRMQLVRWNGLARRAGVMRKVFVGSIMDFFEDNPDVNDFRADRIWPLLEVCNSLYIQLLTKRPENIWRFLPDGFAREGNTTIVPHGKRWDHIWLGTTVENMAQAERRIQPLIDIPCSVHFLSVEPMLEEMDLTPWLATNRIQWVIVGGESAQRGRCREFNVEWAESIIVQCDGYNVPVFVKQMGSKPLIPSSGLGTMPLMLKQKAGTDASEWPEWLRRQEFPHGK